MTTQPVNIPLAKPDITFFDQSHNKSVTLSIDTFKVEVQGEQYSILDIADECADVDAVLARAKAKALNAGQLLVHMAHRCGQASTFAALCNLLEEYRKWGKPPKGTPPSLKNQYTKSPGTYKAYKSSILSAWESGIAPLQTTPLTRKLARPNAEGKSVVTEDVQLTTPALMAKARRQQSEETTTAPVPHTAGVIVDSTGGQHTHSDDPTAETTIHTPDSDDKDDFATMGACLDPRLGAVVLRVFDAFELVGEDERDRAIRTLVSLAKRLEARAPESMDKASQVV